MEGNTQELQRLDELHQMGFIQDFDYHERRKELLKQDGAQPEETPVSGNGKKGKNKNKKNNDVTAEQIEQLRRQEMSWSLTPAIVSQQMNGYSGMVGVSNFYNIGADQPAVDKKKKVYKRQHPRTTSRKNSSQNPEPPASEWGSSSSSATWGAPSSGWEAEPEPASSSATWDAPSSTWDAPSSTWDAPSATWDAPSATWDASSATWDAPSSTWDTPAQSSAIPTPPPPPKRSSSSTPKPVATAVPSPTPATPVTSVPQPQQSRQQPQQSQPQPRQQPQQQRQVPAAKATPVATSAPLMKAGIRQPTLTSSTGLMPLVVQADLSHICCDVIAYPSGCWLSEGLLSRAIEQIYGAKLHKFLRAKLNCGSRPLHSFKSFREGDHKAANEDIAKNKGLKPGFVSYVKSSEIKAKVPECTSGAPDLLVAVIGAEYAGQVTPVTIAELISNVFENLSTNAPAKNGNVVVAFPTFGIGRGGFSKDRLPVLKAQITAMSQGSRRFPHIVPILVTYGETIHRLALAARKIVLKEQHNAKIDVFETLHENMAITELGAELASDRLVLFAGAGISLLSGLPTWRELVTQLAVQAGIPIPTADSNDAFLTIAEEAKKKLKDRFADVIRQQIGHNAIPSTTHYLLAGLPMSFVVTTNFDDLLETAMRRTKKVAFAISNHHDVARVPFGEQVNVLKIHGDISNPNELVMTKSDYDAYFTRRPAVSALLKGLLLNRTFLFVGYSLRDPNLNTIFNEVSTLLQEAKRPAYAVLFEATDSDVKYWQSRGIIILRPKGANFVAKTISFWQFLDALQLKHFEPHGAWLAEDSDDLLPEDPTGDGLRKHLLKLSKSVKNLSKYYQEHPSQDLADFLLPWMSLASAQGCSLHARFWEDFSQHFMTRANQTEADKLDALKALVNYLRASKGRWEKGALAQLQQIEDALFKRDEKAVSVSQPVLNEPSVKKEEDEDEAEEAMMNLFGDEE